MKAKPIGSAMAAIFFTRCRPTRMPRTMSGIRPATTKQMMAMGIVSSEITSRAKPPTTQTTAMTAMTVAVVTVMSNGPIGASPQTGQVLRKSGGQTFGANVGAQRCPFDSRAVPPRPYSPLNREAPKRRPRTAKESPRLQGNRSDPPRQPFGSANAGPCAAPPRSAGQPASGAARRRRLNLASICRMRFGRVAPLRTPKRPSPISLALRPFPDGGRGGTVAAPMEVGRGPAWRIRHKLLLGVCLVCGALALLLAGTLRGLCRTTSP